RRRRPGRPGPRGPGPDRPDPARPDVRRRPGGPPLRRPRRGPPDGGQPPGAGLLRAGRGLGLRRGRPTPASFGMNGPRRACLWRLGPVREGPGGGEHMPPEHDDYRENQLAALRRYAPALDVRRQQHPDQAQPGERRRTIWPWLLVTLLLMAVSLAGGI